MGIIIGWVMLIQIWFKFGECSKEGDRIARLPGQPSVSFQQFSGYISVDVFQNRNLFYYFVEAHTDPASKPLVLWLNGGPGCSSVGAGAFLEHGPFRPKGDVLIHNEFSWNTVANILYLESPAGVGFSFSANTTFYSTVNDKITAQDNLIFLEQWLENFPKYKNRDFYITGESYAGHYVPQLARLIVQSKQLNIKLKAIAIGNPLLEFNTDFNSRGDYLWSHGVISDATHKLVNTVCSSSQIVREEINRNVSAACSEVNELVTQEISDFVNVYSVNLDVCLSPPTNSQPAAAGRLHFHSLASAQRPNQSDPKPASAALPQFSEDNGKIDVCIFNEVDAYLNRVDVQKALHAILDNVFRWNLCSNILEYDLTNLLTPTIYTVGSLVRSGIRVLIYSGDQDAVIPFIGSRTLVNKLAKVLRLNATLPYSPWFHKHQVGGWAQAFGDKNILSFATIRGAAHQAPYTSPERSLALFTAFLAGSSL
ncbi:serine carboxypeptidase-like 45 [Momordica charantia]|uniref:Carboxypeptidase n=1 Tax=Momordica charantia TaxID=3673 RepID=A0A6J1DKM3_MOMCH|nr:serine carboxypeptidase-like 45 [Momordica charantia]